MNTSIQVSIIIPTYNSLEKLLFCLKSIKEINFPSTQYEVIVVDDGSDDETEKFVKSFTKKISNKLYYIYQKNQGPASARNRGIKKAKGEYLLIIDSDCFVHKEIINHYIKHFPEKMLGGVGGNVVPDSDNIVSKYLDYRAIWLPGFNDKGISYLVTANAFFSKEAIINAGYFDEDFRLPGGEEPELCYRMREKGYHFRYDQNAVVIHSHRTCVRQMIKMFFAHGIGTKIAANKWPHEFTRKYSFINILFGTRAIKNFAFDYVRQCNFSDAVAFMILNYIDLFSHYYGYRFQNKKTLNINV